MPTTFARSLAAIGLSLVVTGTMACGGTKQDAKTPASGGGDSKDGAVEVGKHAPDLSIQTVNGQGSISLDSLQGKVAVIDFWATWCGPCKQSFPKLESLSKRHAGKVVIVGVSVDDDKDGVVPFAKANGASFPIGWDDGHAIANRWHVETMPTTVILDSTGTVRYIHAGYHDDEPEQVDKELLGLVNESPSKGDKATAVASNDAPPSTSSGDDAAKADDPPPAPPPKKAAKPKRGGKKKKPKKADPSAA
ncbi:MAG TPA: TlpA disulfide reductase family protein [Labilithrix sp.]